MRRSISARLGEACIVFIPISMRSAIFFQRSSGGRRRKSCARAWTSAAELGNSKGKPVAGSMTSFTRISSLDILAKHGSPFNSGQ
jgi:hypothetical protein